MPNQNREVAPGPRAGTVRVGHEVVSVPAGWVHLEPGDAALTRRVKKSGPVWTMQEKRGRKTFSLGLFAEAARIQEHRADLERERRDPAYGRKLEQGRARRAQEQAEYAEDFVAALQTFLRFAPVHQGLARELAQAISDHAVPVGSGTVARTKRIPIERRAEAATIAWLRHATTGYDDMHIPRIKGMRREVRRMLAERSRELLERYRRGESVAPERCPLRRGLTRR
ncbi:MAG: DUF2293 domain-containing protein [Myxococcales bacterium]